MRRKLVLAFFVLSTAMFRGAAMAAEPIGNIVFSEGVGDIARGERGAPELVSGTAPVYVHDRIRTKSYSKMQIVFEDKSVLKLAPNTCVTIQEYRLGDDKRREMAKLLLTRGKVEAIVAKTGAPDTFSVNTPNALGSVKGSDIFVSYLAGQTGVFVKEGAMTVHNPAFPSAKVKVSGGDSVSVAGQKQPGDVRAAMDIEMAGHQKDVEATRIKKWIPADGAAVMTAVVVSTAGETRVYRKGGSDWTAVKTGQTLSEGDTLQTGTDGRVEVRLGNGNSLFLEGDSELSFESLKYDPASGDFENRFKMTRGRLSSVVERLGKGSTFKVETPAAIASVRGTFLRVVAIPPPTPGGLPQAEVFFEGGGGDVTSPLTNETQPVGAGQHVMTGTGGVLLPPAPTSPADRVALGQAWAAAQTSDQYGIGQTASGGQDGAPFAPPPPPPPVNGQDAARARMSDADKLALMSTLTFDQIIRPPPPPPPTGPFYQNNLPKGPGTDIGINTASLALGLHSDGHWAGGINGTFSSAVGSPWSLNFYDSVSGDELHFTITGPLTMNTANGTFDVTSLDSAYDKVLGTNPDKELTLSGTPKGSFSSTSTSGEFRVDMGGTWVDV